MVGQQGSSVAV